MRPARLRALKSGPVTQFLAADKKGRAFLLKGDTLEVFRLRPGQEPKLEGRLACPRPPETADAAAMDPSASTWVVSATGFELDLCDFKESRRPASLAGLVSSLTFSGTGPLVSVVPIGGMPGPDAAGRKVSRVPRVLELDRGAWKPLSWAPLPLIEEPSRGIMTQVKAQTDALICASPKKNAVWLAFWNSYRVQDVSAFDAPGFDLVVGSGKVEWESFSAREREQIAKELREKGLDPAANKGGKARPRSVIRALLCGRDGLLYLFVDTLEGLALDRFDPDLAILQRILLDGVEVGGGPMTATLSADEILFGGRFASDGLWRIPLADLETARWKPVLGGRLNGKPLP